MTPDEWEDTGLPLKNSRGFFDGYALGTYQAWALIGPPCIIAMIWLGIWWITGPLIFGTFLGWYGWWKHYGLSWTPQ